MGLYGKREGRSSAFLKTGHRHNCFHGPGKERLNNFPRIGDNSELISLKTTTGTLSGPVAFLGVVTIDFNNDKLESIVF